jgi:hypothetical protein
MGKKFDLIINVVTLVAALAVCVVVVRQFHTESTPRRTPPILYKPGDSVSAVFSVDFSKAPKTVIIVTQSNCPVCKASAGFYRSILAQRDRLNANVRIVIAAPESDSEIDSYLRSENVRADAVVQIPRGRAAGIKVTPTIVVANDQGVVERTWVGWLKSSGEDGLLQYLFGEVS